MECVLYFGISLSILLFLFVGEDYSIASSDVVLLEGETSKAVPIYIINDVYPELEESFLVQLLNETTGGAKLGVLTEAIIIIEASDDPYGLFGNQTSLCLFFTCLYRSYSSLFLEIQNQFDYAFFLTCYY